MDNNSVGLGDAMLLANQGKDTNCWWIWIFLLFFLMGGNGWNNGNNANMAAELSAAQTRATVWESNDAQSNAGALRDISRQINQVGDGIASSFVSLNGTLNNGFTGQMRDTFGVQTAMMGGFNNTAQAIAENRFAQQSCCCETNRNIDGVRYDAALNTAAINTTATANTQKILDKLCMMEANAKDAEINALRQQLSAANLAVSQQAQNAQLISAIRPYPAPAYVVSSPYGGACPCAAG